MKIKDMDNILCYPGGKKYLLNHIYKILPKHDLWVDVFGGGGTVTLYKEPSNHEVFNDINGNLTCLFEKIQNNVLDFIEYSELHSKVSSRDLFKKSLKKLNDGNLNPMQRAVLFFYVNRYSFSGNGTNFAGFSVNSVNKSKSLENKLRDPILNISERIKNIIFENQDFEVLLKRKSLNHKDVLIFCDPPYKKGGEMYEKMSGGVEWDYSKTLRMVEILENLDSKVIITIDEDSKTLGLSSKWRSIEVDRVNMMSIPKNDGKRSHDIEYIHVNFDYENIIKHSNIKKNKFFDF